MATYNEVRAKIAASHREEWLKNHSETQLTYKGDLNVRILLATEEILGSDTAFHEPWAQGIGSHGPERRVFTIYYSNSFVEDIYTVAVDGFRAYIPIPRSAEELVISDWEYRFAQIIQPPYNQLDQYLSRMGIRVK